MTSLGPHFVNYSAEIRGGPASSTRVRRFCACCGAGMDRKRNPPSNAAMNDVYFAPGGSNSSKSLPRDNLKSRLYLKQNQSFSKPKKAKLFDPSDAASSQFVGIRTAPASGPTTFATTGGDGLVGGTTTPTFYSGTPPQTAPARGARKLQTSHGEQFCSLLGGTSQVPLPPGTPELEPMDVGEASSTTARPRYQLPRPTSGSPRRRPNTAASLKSVLSAHENWKRKRGKFALAAKHLPPNYAWMPFLGMCAISSIPLLFLIISIQPEVSHSPNPLPQLCLLSFVRQNFSKTGQENLFSPSLHSDSI